MVDRSTRLPTSGADRIDATFCSAAFGRAWPGGGVAEESADCARGEGALGARAVDEHGDGAMRHGLVGVRAGRPALPGGDRSARRRDLLRPASAGADGSRRRRDLIIALYQAHVNCSPEWAPLNYRSWRLAIVRQFRAVGKTVRRRVSLSSMRRLAAA